MFESINLLRNEIFPNQLLEVVHGDYKWTAKFEWKSPAGDTLSESSITIKKSLPSDFIEFLSSITNGCILYYDEKFGQWGFEIYSIEEIPVKQDVWKKQLGLDLKDNYVVFAEMRGESHVLLFDLNQLSNDMISFAVIEGNPLDDVKDWPRISRSFHEWLDHLIISQGDKYWE